LPSARLRQLLSVSLSQPCRGTRLLVLAVPTRVSPDDFVRFCGPCLDRASDIRFIRSFTALKANGNMPCLVSNLLTHAVRTVGMMEWRTGTASLWSLRTRIALKGSTRISMVGGSQPLRCQIFLVEFKFIC